MPETKINVRSPFFKRYTQANMSKVTLDIYVYSGTKNTDKGTKVLQIVRKPLKTTDNYVIVELSGIIRDYLKQNVDTPYNDNINNVKWVQIESTIT